MTEAEWNSCADPMVMLQWVHDGRRDVIRPIGRNHHRVAHVSDRQLWMIFFAQDRFDLTFAPPADDEEESEKRRLILAKCDAGELFADGLLSHASVMRARHPGWNPGPDSKAPDPIRTLRADLQAPGQWLPGAARGVCGIFREVIGNPFRRAVVLSRDVHAASIWDIIADGRYVHVAPAGAVASDRRHVILDEWLTADVLAVARAAYDGRDFTLLPVLADALESAGCVGQECRRCKGKGWYSRRAADDSGFGRSTVTLACGDCGEAGRFPHPVIAHLRGRDPCPDPECRGRGRWADAAGDFETCGRCRGEGFMKPAHVLGCWALDLILRKA